MEDVTTPLGITEDIFSSLSKLLKGDRVRQSFRREIKEIPTTEGAITA